MRLTSLKDWGHQSQTGTFDKSRMSSFSQSANIARNKAVLVVSIAVFWTFVFASVAVFALKDGKTEQDKSPKPLAVVEAKANNEMVEVLVPTKDIEQDKALEPGMFIKVWRPKMGLPSGVMRSYDEIRGVFARSFIAAHQPLLRDFVTRDRPINPVIGSIPQGFRAVTISIDATRGVEGWARAGAIVDVNWIEEIGGRRSIRLIVPNAKVLSAERQIDPHAEPGAPLPTTVTLLVSERDAQKVSLAQTTGSIVLHLRGANDPKESDVSGVMTVRDLDGRIDGPAENGVQGIVRIKRADGSTEEFAVMDNKIVRKHF